ncbi:MAG: fibrobacter succinogenes major paralogous domain-containing protein [Rikenellaceae bacterium]|nr:fibrobacter succinogenes major paralogous domain-containing protein [Rikenellaceae bacterium]
MEFLAVGYRGGSDGSLTNAGTWDYYWSSVAYTSNTTNAYRLYFSSSDLYVSNNLKQTGRSVRCVR